MAHSYKYDYAGIVGKQFGRLTVVSTPNGIPDSRTKVLCKCQCGVLKEIMTKNLFLGGAKSCGCANREALERHRRTNGWYEQCKDHPLRHVWLGMMCRCYKTNHTFYHRYGGRGIGVCSRWHSFDVFVSDVGPRPEGTSLDRINNDDDYAPENCRWATQREQMAHTSCSRLVEYKGETLPLAHWAKKLQVSHQTLHARFDRGWTVEAAFDVTNLRKVA